MNKLKNIICTLTVLPFLGFSQNETTVKPFGLQEAIDFALKNNATYLNTQRDAEYNRYKKNELIGTGLPQINGSASLTDNAILPTSLLPGIIMGPAYAGQYIPVKFGVQWNAVGSLSASQLLFSSDYFVGLQAAKGLMELSQKNADRSKTEIVQNVTKAYYGALVNKARVQLLELSIARIKLLKDNTTALHENGFVEKIDVQRLEVSYNNMMTEKEKTLRLVELSYAMLKFQIGYDVNKPIELSDNLDKLKEFENDQNVQLIESPDITKRPEYLVMQAQQKLNELDLKRFRLAFLPIITANGYYNQMFQRKELELDKKTSWFPLSAISLNLQLPLFTGFQRYNRIKEAEINLMKTKSTFTQLQQSINLEVANSATVYKNAVQSLQTQKKNIELAQNIFDVTKKKYEQGVGSSLELNTAENDLYTAQTNYYNSLYDVIIAKTDYLKATGTLVK
ncbi:MAG: TolC family protein [Bacteroidetes bacterium]|nr:TolC family protein [Bacteroidota bacterium]